jgi:hypothetical protein
MKSRLKSAAVKCFEHLIVSVFLFSKSFNLFWILLFRLCDLSALAERGLNLREMTQNCIEFVIEYLRPSTEQITDVMTSFSFFSPDQGRLRIPAGGLQPLAGISLHLPFGVLVVFTHAFFSSV